MPDKTKVMRKGKIFFIIISIIICSLSSCRSNTSITNMQNELNEFVKDKDAQIGIAVIIDGKDTVEVNGNKPFPMLSVYKFPIAVALGDYLRFSDKILTDPITICQSDLKADTYSPMRDQHAGEESFQLTLHEIMAYALQQSDNNASDILLKIMGGTDNAMLSLKRLGTKDINVVSTEAEMYENQELCYQNSATPTGMACLIESFDQDFDDAYTRNVKQLMETCKTGVDRLAKPLSGTNAIIGHKTGTGFTLPGNRLMAINDVGYVHLPDGSRYAIAVFIENSGYDIMQTEALIADISRIVLTHIQDN